MCTHQHPVALALAVCLAVTLALADGAQALTLANRSQVAQELLITENGKTRRISVPPGEVVGPICAKGCTIALPNGDVGEFEGDEVLLIDEDGYFVEE